VSDLERNADLLAGGLWARLRDILLAQSRWDRFVPDPEGGGSETDRGAEAPSPAERRRVAEEMVLRALRVGADPVNHAILVRLGREEATPLASLMDETGLPRVPLGERIFDLAQVGLAAWAPETREARATGAGLGLVGIVGEISSRLARHADERWAETAPPGRTA